MPKPSAIKARFSGILGDAAGAARAPLGHAPADACLGGGLRLAALHEVFPAASGNEAVASGFALALAARVSGPRKWLLWVRQDFSALENGDLHAPGLLEMGIDPNRVLMVCAPDAMGVLRTGAEGLTCAGFGAVIIEVWGRPKIFDLVASRRLALAAAEHGVTAIVLRFGTAPEPSATETRWIVGAAPSRNAEDWGTPVFDAALVRHRHGACGRWVMEWGRDNGIFRQTHSRALATAPSDRPVEAAMEGFRQAG